MPGPASYDTDPSIRSFFEAYRAAFGRLEAPLIAGLFAYPCHIAGDAEEVTLTIIPTREAWIRQLSHLLDVYREISFSSAHIFRSVRLTARCRGVAAVPGKELVFHAGRT